MKHLRILGTRGIPARHGGFETFAERLALHLTARGWDVSVYCQVAHAEREPTEWQGVRRIPIASRMSGAPGTILFDLKSILHATREQGLVLTLGYNTAIFSVLLRLKRIRNIMNMDGLEWRRGKWGPLEKCWLYANERLGCWFADHLVADHPAIQSHLETRISSSKITMIPYGADEIQTASNSNIASLGLAPSEFALVIARPEPENSILEIVSGFSARCRRKKLVVLGNYQPEANSYHRAVFDSASAEVIFPGAIYDQDILSALRLHTALYVHGHSVGGTNPSLVEALGAGSPILAHDNQFNRWVAGSGARFFKTSGDCDLQFSTLLDDPEALAQMREASRARHLSGFKWETVLDSYEQLLREWLP